MRLARLKAGDRRVVYKADRVRDGPITEFKDIFGVNTGSSSSIVDPYDRITWSAVYVERTRVLIYDFSLAVPSRKPC